MRDFTINKKILERYDDFSLAITAWNDKAVLAFLYCPRLTLLGSFPALEFSTAHPVMKGNAVIAPKANCNFQYIIVLLFVFPILSSYFSLSLGRGGEKKNYKTASLKEEKKENKKGGNKNEEHHRIWSLKLIAKYFQARRPTHQERHWKIKCFHLRAFKNKAQ